MKKFIIGLFIGILVAMPTGAFAAGYITSADIKDFTIKTQDLATSSVNGNKIADGSIKYNDMGRKSVGNKQLIDNSIGYTKLRSNVINHYKIQSGAVRSDEILNGTIKLEDLSPAVIAAINAGGGSGGGGDPIPAPTGWTTVKTWSQVGGQKKTENFNITKNEWRIISTTTDADWSISYSVYKNGSFDDYISKNGAGTWTDYFTGTGTYSLDISGWDEAWTVTVQQKN